MSSYFKKRTFESMRCSQNSWTCSNQEPYPTTKKRRTERQLKDRTTGVNMKWTLNPASGSFTFVIHEAPAELLEGSPVAHGPERAVELVVGHHQVLRITSHVDHLEMKHHIWEWPQFSPQSKIMKQSIGFYSFRALHCHRHLLFYTASLCLCNQSCKIAHNSSVFIQTVVK